MTPAAIAAHITSVLCSQLGVDEEEVVPTATICNDLGADSLDTVEIVMACEEEFGVEIPDADAEQWVTVGDLITYIERRLART